MSFAALNGLLAIGILSVLAMSAGTFVTVSILAAIAVNARHLALKMSRKPAGKFRIQTVMEYGPPLCLFSLPTCC